MMEEYSPVKSSAQFLIVSLQNYTLAKMTSALTVSAFNATISPKAPIYLTLIYKCLAGGKAMLIDFTSYQDSTTRTCQLV